MRVYDFISGRIFSKLFTHTQLVINAIYRTVVNGTHVEYYQAANQTVRRRCRLHSPVEPLIVEHMGGDRHGR